MSKIKIMLSNPMKGKTKQEIDTERNEMANLLFDYYGDGNCEIISSVIKDYEQKSDLECLSESIFFMSMADILAMGYNWKDARGCKIEHEIAKAYHVEIVYLNDLKEELE